MAYDDESTRASWARTHWKTIVAVAFILATAAFFRIAFNYGPAVNDGDYRFAGNDDYYHLRVVDHVMANGEHLVKDPLLNYPSIGINPRPPLFDWAHAIGGRLAQFAGMEQLDAGRASLEWGSALWGILTCIPVWLIGRALYSNRAGLWASFLVATSPAHIQRATFGLGDHDAMIIFFLVLGTFFLLKALRLTRDASGPRRWSNFGDVAHAMGEYAATHTEGMAYAFLAGISWAAIGVMWEGYPYVAAIYAIYFGFQLLTNHVRGRDSTRDVLIMVIVMGLLTLVPLPYFWATGRIAGTTTAAVYILAGLVVAAIALVPTRDLPWILTLPSMAFTAFLFWAVVTFGFPDIGQQIFSVNGYFSASRIYSTIAEAQKTQLGLFVFSIGFMTFFLALIGFVYATIRFFKTRERDQLFLVAWGLISIYMAFAATRFVFNAAPVFAILAGWVVDKLMGWMNWRERFRSFQALRHDSYVRAARSVLGPKQVAGALFVAITLIAPNVLFSLDAAIPAESRAAWFRDHPNSTLIDRQGAFGSGFLQDDWVDTYTWLGKQDTDRDCNDRPAHIAWWDYGFWEVAIACHPTVSDNFQNGVQMAGRMLLAESEREEANWMIMRLLEGDWRRGPGHYSPEVLAAMAAKNASLPGALPEKLTYQQYDSFYPIIAAQTKSSEEANLWYWDVAKVTRTSMGYFLCDFRMLPYDLPDTARIESSSILYAPIFLAGRNPDDYVKTVIVAGGQEYTQVGYEMGPNNESIQLKQPKIMGTDGKTYVHGGSYLIRTLADGKTVDYSHNQGRGVQISQEKLSFQDKFYRTMFYRCFIGGDGQKPDVGQNYHANQPGNGLQFWRMVYNTQSVKLLAWSLGAPMTGHVTFEGGPAHDVMVDVADEFGVPHSSAPVGADGSYQLLLPPSSRNETTGELIPMKLRVTSGGQLVDSRNITVTPEQAMRTAPITIDGDFELQRGTLDVFAFIDKERNGSFNESADFVAAGATVSIGGVSGVAGDDGHVVLTGVEPGTRNLTGVLEGYQVLPARAAVRSGQTTQADLRFEVPLAAVTLTVADDLNAPVPGLMATITAKAQATEYTEDPGQVPPSDNEGHIRVQLRGGGTYVLNINETRPEGGGNVTFTASQEIVVPMGTTSMDVNVRVTRTQS